MASLPLLHWTPRGLYCAQGDFYIDPIRPVPRALITHAHSDHAHIGMGLYIAQEDSIPILRLRLGERIQTVGLPYGVRRSINGVNISFHPAGHIIGSAQIRVSYQGEVWVASGDYHTLRGGYCASFEPVQCHTFLTESTFGIPTFSWTSEKLVAQDMVAWIQDNAAQGFTSILLCYALGKAQRVAHLLQHQIEPPFLHYSIQRVHDRLRSVHPTLPIAQPLGKSLGKIALRGKVILAPPGVLKSQWLKKLPPCKIALVTGWAGGHAKHNQSMIHQTFALSDHADWQGLIDATIATGATQVLVNHGYTEAFSAHLRTMGLDAQPLIPSHMTQPSLF
jgi:putative mRNA 3-end processing factor